MKTYEEFVNEGRKASSERAVVQKLEKTVAELKKQNEELKLDNRRLKARLYSAGLL